MNIFKLILRLFRRNEPALTLIQRHEIADASAQELYALFGNANVTIVEKSSRYSVTANLPRDLNKNEISTISAMDFTNLTADEVRTLAAILRASAHSEEQMQAPATGYDIAKAW
jgi:hypothetical protein